MPDGAQWTIDELAQLVGEALDVDYPGQTNGRVRDVPDRRTIRWYTTIGLLDRPAAMRGRTALYGRRHLLQLVAVKRLQADGRTIAEVQEALLGADDATLDELAHLPELPGTPLPPSPAASALPATSAQPATSARRATSADSASPPPVAPVAPEPGTAGPVGPAAPAGFAGPEPGTAAPAGFAALRSAASETRTATSAARGTTAAAQSARFWAARPASPQPAASLVPGIRLANGVTLVLDGAPRPLDAADLTAIADAATALLDVLHDRGLAAPTEGGQP